MAKTTYHGIKLRCDFFPNAFDYLHSFNFIGKLFNKSLASEIERNSFQLMTIKIQRFTSNCSIQKTW